MQYYLSARQDTRTPTSLMVRVRDDGPAAAAALRRELLAVDASFRYADVHPLRDLIDAQARSWKLGATLFSLFGALALLVAGVGLYSVLAFGVVQRTFELGVRAALGAPASGLVALVLYRAFALVGTGVALGLLAAYLAGPRLAPLLFEVSPADPLTFAGVAAVLLAVSLLAASLPAWRATRVEPSVALRAE